MLGDDFLIVFNIRKLMEFIFTYIVFREFRGEPSDKWLN